MKTKLTLSVDQKLIEFARQEARVNKKSISCLFSDFLALSMTLKNEIDTPGISDMVGSLKHYAIDDSKQAIRTSYAKKIFSLILMLS